jgi:hypothetical protein
MQKELCVLSVIYKDHKGTLCDDLKSVLYNFRSHATDIFLDVTLKLWEENDLKQLPSTVYINGVTTTY